MVGTTLCATYVMMHTAFTTQGRGLLLLMAMLLIATTIDGTAMLLLVVCSISIIGYLIALPSTRGAAELYGSHHRLPLAALLALDDRCLVVHHRLS